MKKKISLKCVDLVPISTHFQKIFKVRNFFKVSCKSAVRHNLYESVIGLGVWFLLISQEVPGLNPERALNVLVCFRNLFLYTSTQSRCMYCFCGLNIIKNVQNIYYTQAISSKVILICVVYINEIKNHMYIIHKDHIRGTKFK